MKKILLVVFLACISYFNVHAHIFTGPDNQDIIRNSVTEFTYQNTTEGVQLFNSKWTVENGTFVDANGNTSIGSPMFLGPSSFQRIYVKWNNPNTTGKVIVELAKDNSTTYSVKKTWTVNVIESLPPTSGNKYEISGKSVISVGETAVYTLEAKEKKISSWQLNKDYFQIIKEDDKTITLKALKYTSPYSNAVLVGKIDANSRGEKVIRIKPTYTIELTGNGVICNNGITSYKIKDIDLTPNATVSWEAGDLMTFVSGQATSTATFKGAGNGKGIVKATVTWNAEKYPIENSDVWVGKPGKIWLTGFEQCINPTAAIPMFASNQKVNLIANSDGAKEATWDLSGDARYYMPPTQGAGSGNINIVTNTVYNGNGSFKLSVRTSNQCGISDMVTKYAEVKGLEDNTPLPPIVEMSIPFSPDPQPTTIRIYSYPTGSLVYQKKNTISFDIQSTNLGEGIYILEMTDQKGNVTREKVMKSKQ